jgi:hypothetical protein
MMSHIKTLIEIFIVTKTLNNKPHRKLYSIASIRMQELIQIIAKKIDFMPYRLLLVYSLTFIQIIAKKIDVMPYRLLYSLTFRQIVGNFF